MEEIREHKDRNNDVNTSGKRRIEHHKVERNTKRIECYYYKQKWLRFAMCMPILGTFDKIQRISNMAHDEKTVRFPKVIVAF